MSRHATPTSAHLWAWGLLLAGGTAVLWVAGDRLAMAKPHLAPPPPPPPVQEAAPPTPWPVVPPPRPRVPEPTQPVVVPPSPETLREAAEREYDQALAAIGDEADKLQPIFSRFLAAGWEGSARGGYARNWYALWDGGLQGKAFPAYQGTYEELIARVEALRRRFQAAEEAARKADVLPGARREARRKYRLEDRLWER